MDNGAAQSQLVRCFPPGHHREGMQRWNRKALVEENDGQEEQGDFEDDKVIRMPSGALSNYGERLGELIHK